MTAGRWSGVATPAHNDRRLGKGLPAMGFALILFVAPFGIYQEYFGGLLSVAKVVAILTIVAAILRMAVERVPMVGSPILLPMTYFVIAFVPSLFLAKEPLSILPVLVTMVGYLIYHVIIVSFVREGTALRRIIMAVEVSAGIVAAVGLYQYLGGKMIVEIPGQDSVIGAYQMVRLLGTELNPSAFANHFVLAIPAGLGLLMTARTMEGRVLWAGVAFLATVTMLLTLSRAATLGLAVGLAVVILVLVRDRRLRWSLMTAVVAVGSLIVVFWPQAATIRLQATIYNPFTDQSVVQRLLLLGPSVRMFLDNLLFGVGFGNSKDYLHMYGAPLLNLPPHNVFLGIACELGVLGLVPFVVLLYMMLRVMVVACSRTDDPQMKGLIAGILGSLIGHLTMGMFHMDYVHVTFWILASLGVGGARWATQVDGAEGGLPPVMVREQAYRAS